MVHLAGEGRGEQIRAVRVLLVLLNQQLHCRLGDGHQPDRVLRLGPGQFQGILWVANVLPAHRDGSALGVYIHPPQGYQFPLP